MPSVIDYSSYSCIIGGPRSNADVIFWDLVSPIWPHRRPMDPHGHPLAPQRRSLTPPLARKKVRPTTRRRLLRLFDWKWHRKFPAQARTDNYDNKCWQNQWKHALLMVGLFRSWWSEPWYSVQNPVFYRLSSTCNCLRCVPLFTDCCANVAIFTIPKLIICIL